MTSLSARSWGADVAPPARRRATLMDIATDGLAVLMVLIFSQGWILPLMGEDISPSAGGVIRLMFFPAYLAGLTLMALNIGDVMRVLLRQPFLILMILLAAASYTWSINPAETLRRFVAVGFTTLGGVALAARYRWSKLAELLAIAFAILCVCSLGLAIAKPSIGVMSEIFPGAWRGLWPEKNALGGNMALFFPAFVAAAIYHPRRRWLWAGAAALCFGLLLMSTSKTSLVALMLGVAGIIFVALVRRGPATAVAVTFLGVLGVMGGAMAWLLASDVILDILGKDATLTGRTEIWAAVMTQVKHHPLLGHGYGTVWTDEGSWGPLAWIVKYAGFRPIHAHSSWFEQLLGLGAVGLVAWALFYLQTMATAIVAVFRDKGALLAFPFLLVYSLISITESITLVYNDLRWTLFVAMACKLAFPDRMKDA